MADWLAVYKQTEPIFNGWKQQQKQQRKKEEHAYFGVNLKNWFKYDTYYIDSDSDSGSLVSDSLSIAHTAIA